MLKSDIKEILDRSGFVSTKLDGGGRITARGPRLSDGKSGRKTTVHVQKDGETLHNSQHPSNAAAAQKYVKLVEKYG